MDQRRQSRPAHQLSGRSNLTFLMYTNMILQANFVTNPFLAAMGVYNGLFYPAGGVTEASSGFISAAVTSNSGLSPPNCCSTAGQTISAGHLT